MRVLLAIPAYRCATQIRRVVAKLAGDPGLRSKIAQVVIFDNQSPDSTTQAAREEIAKLEVEDWIWLVRNNANYGLGGSQKLAFTWARENGFAAVVVLHGDDQAEVQDIHPLLAALEQGSDAVLGARFMAGSKREGYSLLRTFGNMTLNGIYTLLARRPTFDLGSGLNAFRVVALDFSALATFSNQFTFNMDLLLNLFERQRRVVFLPILWREEDQRSNASAFSVGFKALKTVILWRLGVRNTDPEANDLSFKRVA